MADRSKLVKDVLARMRVVRERAGIDADRLAEDLILGPGWIQRFESGETLPDIDTLFVILDRIRIDPGAFFRDIQPENTMASAAAMTRMIRAEQAGGDIIVHFQYAAHDAQYRLQNATVAQFGMVLQTLRDGLARLVAVAGDITAEKQIKTGAVAAAFRGAVALWPHANPSDIWWFLIYRAYCDPYNHPAAFARLSFEQSWKRTGGWALEEIAVRHYGPALSAHGITIEIATGARKRHLLAQLDIGRRLITDKVDVILTGPGERVFGVIHVKASFAERRTDDVPMSEALVRAGYFSPLWTMDCKSTPAERPINRGELGVAVGKRSEKRTGIEDDAEFSACFSYNRNTLPTVNAEAKSRVILCDFNDPNDAFTREVVAGWKRFAERS